MRNALCAVLVAAAGLTCPTAAGATAIGFEAINVDGDLWQYNYVVTEGQFDAHQHGFAIFFDPDLYRDLTLDPILPSPAGWDVITTVPEPGLGSDGTFDALALLSVAAPPAIGGFAVRFTWLGPSGAAPGSQPFMVYDLIGDLPTPIENGVTTGVPEPSTLLLVAAGALVALRSRRRRDARSI